jgi:hypothetical protein
VDQVDGGIVARPGRKLSRRDVLVRAPYGLGGLVAVGGAGALVRPSSASAATAGSVAGAATGTTRLSGTAQPRSVCSGRSVYIVLG